MEHVEYPGKGDFLECRKCNVKITFTESTFKERRERLIDFIEAHLHSSH